MLPGTEHSTANRNNHLNQTLDWTTAANNMDLGGYNTRAGLAREQNNEDAYGLGLRQEQFNQGANWLQQQTAAQDRGAGAVAGIGGSQYGQGLGAGNLARGFGNDASQQLADLVRHRGSEQRLGTATRGRNGECVPSRERRHDRPARW
jgi:hypothetical protein